VFGNALQTFGEFGALSLMLGTLLLGIGIVLRWVAVHGVAPLVQAGIGYLNQQTEATRKNVDSLEQLAKLEYDIRHAVIQMRDESREADAMARKSAHELQTILDDEDSKFVTVRTNRSISLLAQAVARIAKAVDVDIADLVREIERTAEGRT